MKHREMDNFSKNEDLNFDASESVTGSHEVVNPQQILLFDNQVMKVSEAAAFLKVSEKTVYRLVQDGILPHQRLGGCIRFSQKELIKFLEGG